MFYNRINYVKKLILVCAGNGSHYRSFNPVAPQHSDFLNRGIKRAGLSYHIVGFTHPVDRKLIGLATQIVKPFADLIYKVKRIAENGETYIVFM